VSAIVASGKSSFFVHPLALVDCDRIGDRTRVWAFAHVMSGAEVGADCNIGEHAFIETGAKVGNNVTVKNGVSIWSGITVEDNVFLGPHCVLCGIIVGRYAFIGAGAVVIRSVPDFALVVGNPARQIGWMCVCARSLSLPLVPQAGESCMCQQCGRRYVANVQAVDGSERAEVAEQ